MVTVQYIINSVNIYKLEQQLIINILKICVFIYLSCVYVGISSFEVLNYLQFCKLVQQLYSNRNVVYV